MCTKALQYATRQHIANAEFLLCNENILLLEIIETLSRVMHYCTPTSDICLIVASRLMSIITSCLLLEATELISTQETIIR